MLQRVFVDDLDRSLRDVDAGTPVEPARPAATEGAR